MKRFLIALITLVTAAMPLFAAPTADEARLLRFPAVGGGKIVFCYAGNLYSVDINGGRAVKLTSDVGYECFPKISPDGKTVESFLTADNCIVDRKSKSGWVAGNAQMDWDGTNIKGRGIYFSFDREFIKIFSQTEIRTKALKLDAGKVLSK